MLKHMTRASARGVGLQLACEGLMQLIQVEPPLAGWVTMLSGHVTPISQEVPITCCGGVELPTRLVCFP